MAKYQYRYEEVTADNYSRAGEIIKTVFPPSDAVGVDISFRLSITPRDKWSSVCNQFDAIHGTNFQAQFEPIARLKYFTLMENGRPAGVSGIYSLKGELDQAWTGWLGVAESAQGRGNGNRVLQHVIDLAKKQKCDVLRLWTTESETFGRAHSMYMDAGFKSQGELDGVPLSSTGSKYEIYSVNLADPSRPVQAWPQERLNEVGLAGADFVPKNKRGSTLES